MTKTTTSLLHHSQHSNVLQIQLTSSPSTMSPNCEMFFFGRVLHKKCLQGINSKDTVCKMADKKNCSPSVTALVLRLKSMLLSSSMTTYECFQCVLEFRTEIAAMTAVIKILPHHLALEDSFTLQVYLLLYFFENIYFNCPSILGQFNC